MEQIRTTAITQAIAKTSKIRLNLMLQRMQPARMMTEAEGEEDQSFSKMMIFLARILQAGREAIQ
jgi:hypothetical protein